jgi:beta-galactosidase
MQLGVCYYPEQWPQDVWPEDARRMRELGIRWVRIGEFTWSRIEPEPGRFDWAWLDQAVQILHAEGLKIVLCTPTATPPKWLIDAHPDILAVDLQGRPRGFGSRRHYCFSSPTYRAQSQRITRAMGARYGQHPAVAAWQTDNEYGCHDTVLSTSAAARVAFRDWLRQRYGDIGAVNAAWGTAFWSQTYRGFDEIDLPVLTVTEANPSHRLDYRRFASDEVVAFNRAQVDLLRALSPGRPVAHNFMGFFTGFNHHDVAADLDIAGWDSYPLGFTQSFFLSAEEKVRWARCGHPDIPAFHHDLYRGMCRAGRWWVMEQQPGPVNWAQWNPVPHDGMVRMWTWQAFAHGAEVVSYFRWRQAPFAQEQMHAGLQRPDRSLDQGGAEAAQVAGELAGLAAHLGEPSDRAGPPAGPPGAAPGAATGALPGARSRAPVALVFDYDALWMSQIQPQGADYNALELAFRVYATLRGLGFDVDIVGPHAALDDYRLVVLPVQMHAPEALVRRLTDGAFQVVLAPRCGSKTAALHIPPQLAPGPLGPLAGLQVLRVASLPPGVAETVSIDGTAATVTRWFEDVALRGARPQAVLADGRPVVTVHGRVRYVAGWLDDAGWRAVLTRSALDAQLVPAALPEGLRISRRPAPGAPATLTFAFNFSDRPLAWQPPDGARPLLGNATLPPRGVSIWTDAPFLPASQDAQHATA